MPPVVDRSKLAIGTGILLGCIFGFLFPKQYHLPESSSSSSNSTLISKPSPPNLNFDSTLCAVTDRVVLSKPDYFKLIRPDLVPHPPFGKLEIMLQKVANTRKELILSIITDTQYLEIFFNSIKRLRITNYIAVVFDDKTAEFCKSNGVAFHHVVDLDESTARLKLKILKDVLQLSYNVLYSDPDIVYLQDPFEHLYRDSDFELMSNGDNNMTAYGFNDDDNNVKIMSIGTYNTGFFYIRSGTTSMKLLDRVANRLSHSTSFEVAFNEELFLPSRPGHFGIQASTRIMDFDMFTNSKVILQKELEIYNKKKKPVIVQVNHMDEHKLPIMKAVVEFYVNGKMDGFLENLLGRI